jgi:hypothetical protein
VQSESSAYVQIDTSQQDASTVTQAFSNRYVQLYDERGSPVNPRAHDHGRRLRQAQNDVLSSIGVVERRPSPSDLPGAYKERLEQLHNEDLVGSAVALVSTLTENTCTWWLGSLRDRLLTFRYRDTVFFTRIVAREYQRSGPMMIYAGFPGQLLFTASVQAFAYVAYMVRPVDRLLNVTHATRKTKNFFQQWKNVSRTWSVPSSCCSVFTNTSKFPCVGRDPVLPTCLPRQPSTTWLDSCAAVLPSMESIHSSEFTVPYPAVRSSTRFIFISGACDLDICSNFSAIVRLPRTYTRAMGVRYNL